MRKMLNFVLLDTFSIRGVFGLKLLAVFAILSITGYTSMGVGGIAFGGIFILSVICTQPFTAGIDGLDRFYTTLSLSRKDVVFGRYFFVLLVIIFVTLLYFAIGIVIPLIMGSGLTFEHLPMMFGVYVVPIFIFSILLPILFKLGFKQARPIVQFLPILIVLAIALLDNTIYNGIEYNIFGLINYFDTLPNIVLPLILIFICIAIFAASLKISLFFYSKREF
ncbi:MAG: ABC-2 transporter permease [Defluviitaleaceae bacterium]|nr:ABC-2 transporter permease [Defluviitaleaceae bacterium]